MKGESLTSLSDCRNIVCFKILRIFVKRILTLEKNTGSVPKKSDAEYRASIFWSAGAVDGMILKTIQCTINLFKNNFCYHLIS